MPALTGFGVNGVSLFKRLFGKPRFQRFPDSFTLSKANKLLTLCDWVRQQESRQETVLVLSHFQSTFLENQDALQQAGIEFEILATPSAADSLMQRIKRDASSSDSAQTILTMAQMLVPADIAKPHTGLPPSENQAISLSVIVTERYPIITHDIMLEKFFDQTGATVSMGYLISFDDPILVRLLGRRFIDLLKQLGLGENDLVSSAMTKRGLTRKLKRATAEIENERLAESPEEWIELNLD